MDPTLFNLRHLRAVTAIVDAGSVSGGARAVNLTQPAVTQAIAKLESQVALSLFTRGPGGMIPTEAGRILAKRSARALQFVGSGRVTSPQMRAFLALARNGSYAAAAAATSLREPSLHRAVTDLSLGIGLQLVERRGRGIALTARGHAIARRFRLAHAELSSAATELEALRGREVGRIVVGAMPLCRAQLLPNSIGEFHRLYPNVDIAVVEGSHTELVGPLRDGELDVMIGALRDHMPNDLAQQPLFVDRPVVLARANHPLALSDRKPAAAELAAYPWIVSPREAPLRAQWEHVFRESGLPPPRVAIECGSVIVIRQLLIQDDYLTLLSPAQVAVELEAGWLTRVCAPPGEIKRTIGITRRVDWHPTPLQQAFIDMVHGHAHKLGLSDD
ncbi:MAG: LysR substrate-binding domain-containing protein [Sphingomicrobium sp.]